MGLDIDKFLSTVTTDEKFFLNMPIFWTVSITGVSVGEINGTLILAGETWKANVDIMDMTENSAGNILVAQSVTLPNEQPQFDTMVAAGVDGMGGFLPTYGLKARAGFLERQLSVNFLETQMDVAHNFFRPWLIAIGINGLIEDGGSLKGDMEVRQYSNGGKFIKGFKFNKVFPTAVEGYTLNYNDTDVKIHSVTFGCLNYQQL
jgi:hypothetical protein